MRIRDNRLNSTHLQISKSIERPCTTWVQNSKSYVLGSQMFVPKQHQHLVRWHHIADNPRTHTLIVSFSRSIAASHSRITYFLICPRTIVLAGIMDPVYIPFRIPSKAYSPNKGICDIPFVTRIGDVHSQATRITIHGTKQEKWEDLWSAIRATIWSQSFDPQTVERSVEPVHTSGINKCFIDLHHLQRPGI